MASISFRLTRNDISPALSRMAAAARRPEPVFRAMGTTFMSITMGNFKSGEYRPSVWPAKKDGTPATLQKSGTLSRSFHLSVSNTGATLSSPMIYAAIHQLGAKDQASGKGIPPRPYFPVAADGKLTPKAEEKIRAAGERALQRQAGV